MRAAGRRHLRRIFAGLLLLAVFYRYQQPGGAQPSRASTTATCSEGATLERALLVLATTMAEPSPGQQLSRFTHRTQLVGLYGMLAQSPPHAVLPVVFSKSAELAQLIRSAPGLNDSRTVRIVDSGFRVMFGANGSSAGADAVVPSPHQPEHRQHHTHDGWPIFSSVMEKAEAVAKQIGSPFFGYANADILFSEDLVLTLRMLESALHDGYFAKFDFGGERRGNHRARQPGHAPGGLLVIGRRINVNFESTIEHLSHTDSCDLSQDLVELAKRGTLIGTEGIDYFFHIPGAFKWQRFPDYLLGVPAFDQAVVARAVEAGMAVVDVTDTVHAFHMTGPDGNKAGSRRPEPVRAHNWQLYGADKRKCTSTDCAGFRTTWTPTRQPAIQRLRNPNDCTGRNPACEACIQGRGTRFNPKCWLSFGAPVATSGDTRTTSEAARAGDLYTYRCAAASILASRGGDTEASEGAAPGAVGDTSVRLELGLLPMVREALNFSYLLHAVQRCRQRQLLLPGHNRPRAPAPPNGLGDTGSSKARMAQPRPNSEQQYESAALEQVVAAECEALGMALVPPGGPREGDVTNSGDEGENDVREQTPPPLRWACDVRKGGEAEQLEYVHLLPP